MSESPASRAFAAKLARYSYSGIASAGRSPRKAAIANSPRRIEAGPSTPSPTSRRSPSRRSASLSARKRLRRGYEAGELADDQVESASVSSGSGSAFSVGEGDGGSSDDAVLPDVVDDDHDEDEGIVTPSKRPRPQERHGAQVGASPRAGAGLGRSPGPGSTRSKEKNGKKPRPFASPEMYQHLRPVQDLLKPDLDIVFCGINPGRRSSTLGHHFAHPTNKFWRALHLSGLTPRLVPPIEDHLLPDAYNYGLTNLCDRPTAEQSELSTLEMRLNVLQLSRKISRERPKIVCFVGKKIWDVYESVAVKTARCGTPELEHALKQEEGLQLKVEPYAGEVAAKGKGIEVKQEPMDNADDTLQTIDIKPLPGAAAKKPKPKTVPFNWTGPRSLRLPFAPDESGRSAGHTYFWVVPNTSGLERTPLGQQVVLFGHLRAFLQQLQTGSQLPQHFSTIDIDGVESTVSALRLAAEVKAKRE